MVHDFAALTAALLASFRHNFRSYRALADKALAQRSSTNWLHVPAPFTSWVRSVPSASNAVR